MSSHKEAPSISNDAAADNTDVYAFVSPDKPNTVTLIANYIPLEIPAGGPNFSEFGDDVLYEIHVQNTVGLAPNGTGGVTTLTTYQFTFTTQYANVNTFLYNTGPITSLTSPNFNRKQFVTVKKVVQIGGAAAVTTTLGTNLACPPCNIGPASTPNYAALAKAAIHTLTTGEVVFAGQRAEGFYVDLGAIFDLGQLRPLDPAFLVKMPQAKGVNSTQANNVHSIAIQVPIAELAAGPLAADPTSTDAVIGVYASASRQRSRMLDGDGTVTLSGAFQQISRLGNPLINEVVIPLGEKDKWNTQDPSGDSQFAQYVTKPELAGLLPVLYPGAFPKLAAYTKPRADLAAVLLTGVPQAVGAGFQNFTGTVQADLLRLNVAIPPGTAHNNLGVLGGDVAGFPNGRRVYDDVTTIELRAIAGAVLPLVDKTFTPDAAVAAITQGLTSSNTDMTANNTVLYLTSFPYLGTPHGGYYNPGNDDPAVDLGAQPVPPPLQVGTVPVGAPNTGGGGTAGLQHKDLLVGGGVALLGAAVAGGMAARPKTAGAPEVLSDDDRSDEAPEQP